MHPIDRAIAELKQGVGAAHAEARRALSANQQTVGDNARQDQRLNQMESELRNLATVMSRLSATASGVGDPDRIQSIEQIPGRRIPFDLVVTIPIGANITATQRVSTTISQDGPFIAVQRYATFQSAHEYSVQSEQGRASFKGRSYGRFRPVHSVADLFDGSGGYQPVVGGAFPGTGNAIWGSPSNHSNFRTMEFDGLVEFRNEGSGWPRQNNPVPTSFYAQEMNSPFPLGALDFFERGEVLTWSVTPTHTNNPAYGNVSSFGSGGFYPFLDSQYDVQEGILDPYIEDQETDPITRLPNGFLIIGFSGFRIIQPPGQISLV